METVYLVCLVVAGGIAILSAFGDFLDADVDADLDLDLDVSDVADAGEAGSLATGSAPSAAIFSLRAVVFALFGFGAVGTVLTAFGAAPLALATIALSVGAGLAVGAAVGSLLAYLKRSDTRSRAGDEGFRGMTGRVVLPLRAESAGHIVVRRGPREHTVRALPHSSATTAPEAWQRVVVIEMKNGIAYVGPLENDDDALLP